MSLERLLSELGYSHSPFFHEAQEYAALPMPHLLRDAQRAQVKGAYFIRTTANEISATSERAAVYVAEAITADDARQIHRHLWNQGTTPFLLVLLPGQVRVYTPFAYDELDETVGQVERPLDTTLGFHYIAQRLNFLNAESIDSGDIWQLKGSHLRKETRVDRVLIKTLRNLSQQLVTQHDLNREGAHALIGRFVYLHYLRERDILSDQWLESVSIKPETIFSSEVRMGAFRRLTDAVDERFNGRIFPIDWSSDLAPNADAVKSAGRAFAGEAGGQMPLFKPFDFSFIPIELLSAVYEHFLHEEGKGREEGAFYTSEPVADYLLSELETARPLEKGLKILDPCCGSGMFLVLAFRRLVEQEIRQRKSTKLLPAELRQILTSSIFGVERNPEACLVTEFSLILTLLSYIDPPELHRYQNFKFPYLHGNQIHETDFFSDDSAFWRMNQRFDWIVGNPPWIECDPKDQDNADLISWIERNPNQPVARYRSGEAFSWRVRDRLAPTGVAGLVTQATSLTNDQSTAYREAFFTQNTVHSVTNFSNLAYILFESANEPAATLVYRNRSFDEVDNEIVHFGPMVINQPTLAPYRRGQKAPWVLTIGESEIQCISGTDARRGEGTTWKRALWGNPRDNRAIARLRRIFPTTLGRVADKRGWNVNLGLQLRSDEGAKKHPNQDVATIMRRHGATKGEAETFLRWFSNLRVLEPKYSSKALTRLTVHYDWIVENRWGTFLREGRTAGLSILKAPHLFLWNEFAAFSDEDFIFRHPKLGVSAPARDKDWLKAISLIWSSSVTPYLLFLDLSAGWGISRSTIDLGDARHMPMPDLNPDSVNRLSQLHYELAAAETSMPDTSKWQSLLDDGVAAALSIPSQVMMLAREFKEFRLPLVKGKAPRNLILPPDRRQLQKYASRLKAELDRFLERKERRHDVTVLKSSAGIVVTIKLINSGKPANATVRDADGTEKNAVEDLLTAAKQQYGQWVYVQRSVRIFAGKKIHICKPLRQLEWTETQALLDAADTIAEVAASSRAN